MEAHGAGADAGHRTPAGHRVTVTGYPMGVGGSPIGCQASTAIDRSGFPVAALRGLVDGTSGAPWGSGTTVVGLIGGFDGGGCDENVSYSPPFDEPSPSCCTGPRPAGPGTPPRRLSTTAAEA